MSDPEGFPPCPADRGGIVWFQGKFMHVFRHLIVLVICVALVVGQQCCCCVLAGGASTQRDDGCCCCCAAAADPLSTADAAPVPHQDDRPCRCRDRGWSTAAANQASQSPSGAPITATWGVWIAALAATVPDLAGGVVIAPDCRPAAGEPPPRSGRALLRAYGILRL